VEDSTDDEATKQEPSALSAVIRDISDGEPAMSESETRSQVASEQTAMELSNCTDDDGKSDSIIDQTPLKLGSVNKGSPKRLISYTVQKFRRNHYYVLLLALCTSVLTAYTVFFIYNTSVSSNPIMKQHPQSANTAILTITILGQLAMILLTELTNLVSEKYRWKRVSSKTGVSFLSFLVMGSVSTHSLFMLVTATVWSLLRRRTRFKPYHSLIFQRLLDYNPL
jgi:hypothetical protein